MLCLVTTSTPTYWGGCVGVCNRNGSGVELAVMTAVVPALVIGAQLGESLNKHNAPDRFPGGRVVITAKRYR